MSPIDEDILEGEATATQWRQEEDEQGDLIFRGPDGPYVKFKRDGTIESSVGEVVHIGSKIALTGHEGASLNATWHGDGDHPQSFVRWTYWMSGTDSDSVLTVTKAPGS